MSNYPIFRPASPPKQPLKYIVSRTAMTSDGERRYTPSSSPALHDSPELALLEAERLAVANPGVEFVVLTPVYTTEAAIPTAVSRPVISVRSPLGKALFRAGIATL